jgi:hypothetical protein
MRRKFCLPILLAAPAILLGQGAVVNLKQQAKNIDFGDATLVRPFRTGTLLPATCVVGEMFFKTDAPSGSNTYGCVAANTWAAQGNATVSASDTVLQVVFTNSTTLTIGPNCSATQPCHYRVGSAVYSRVAPATVQLIGGSGTVFIYIGANGDLVAGQGTSSTPSLACTGCVQATPITGFPMDAIPLATWSATNNGAWNPTGTDQRAVLSRERKLTAGANILLTESADTVTVAAISGGFDPMDMTQDIRIDKPGSDANQPVPGYALVSVGADPCASATEAGSGSDIIGYHPQTGAATGEGCYLVAQGSGGAAFYPDIASAASFHVFQFKTRLRSLDTAGQKAYFGLYASTAAGAGATDGVYLESDPGIGPNWQCTVRNGGASTRTNTGVAASTSYATLEVSATISGALVCKVGGVAVTTTAAFPTATWFGFYNETVANSAKQIAVSDVRRKVTGLSR